jgi:metal-sulfur cluster biosynthetic enzyme
MSVSEARIRQLIDEVEDPCSAAHGSPTGLDSMGLVCSIERRDSPQGVEIDLVMRLTSPGCWYFPYFEQEIRRRLETLEDVASVAIAWDDKWDWTPDQMRASTRRVTQGTR